MALVFLYALNFKTLVTLNFYWNQTEITELFCVNKEKPQLRCEGKCHLNTVLSDANAVKDVPFSKNNTEQNLELIFDVVTSEYSSLQDVDVKNKKFIYSKTIIERDSEILSPPPKV